MRSLRKTSRTSSLLQTTLRTEDGGILSADSVTGASQRDHPLTGGGASVGPIDVGGVTISSAASSSVAMSSSSVNLLAGKIKLLILLRVVDGTAVLSIEGHNDQNDGNQREDDEKGEDEADLRFGGLEAKSDLGVGAPL